MIQLFVHPYEVSALRVVLLQHELVFFIQLDVNVKIRHLALLSKVCSLVFLIELYLRVGKFRRKCDFCSLGIIWMVILVSTCEEISKSIGGRHELSGTGSHHLLILVCDFLDLLLQFLQLLLLVVEVKVEPLVLPVL